MKLKYTSLIILTSFLDGQVVGSKTKTPFEVLDCGVDFVQEVQNDNISIISVTAANWDTGTDATAAIVATSLPPYVSSSLVLFRVQGGIAGQRYKVSIKVRDVTNGTQYEGNVQLTVQSQ